LVAAQVLAAALPSGREVAMTKDGRPSLINDIRLFCGSRHSYLEKHEEAHAYGRRIAWFLNGEGFSLGAYQSLYLFFDPSLEPGTVQVTDRGGDWWQRYTDVGVSPKFPNVPDAEECVIRGTFKALMAIRPDQTDVVRKADAIVREHGENLRFLLKRHESRKCTVDISFNIGAKPNPSYLFVTSIDKASGAYAEAEPVPLRFYAEAFDLAGTVKVNDFIAVEPNKSFRAQLITSRYKTPLTINPATFIDRTARPAMSQLVRRRG